MKFNLDVEVTKDMVNQYIKEHKFPTEESYDTATARLKSLKEYFKDKSIREVRGLLDNGNFDYETLSNENGHVEAFIVNWGCTYTIWFMNCKAWKITISVRHVIDEAYLQ